jgi:hypothetical protein
MKFSLGTMFVIVTLICALLGAWLLIGQVLEWRRKSLQTFGEKFLELAQDYDAAADEWEWKLHGNGWSGWAGWDCGREADGIYRAMALTLIERNREMAKAIRAELPGQPGYDQSKYDFATADERQRKWQAWYDDFHKRNNLPASGEWNKAP